MLNPNGEMGTSNFDLTLTLTRVTNGRYIRVIRAGRGDPSEPATMTDDNNVLAMTGVEAYILSN